MKQRTITISERDLALAMLACQSMARNPNVASDAGRSRYRKAANNLLGAAVKQPGFSIDCAWEDLDD